MCGIVSVPFLYRFNRLLIKEKMETIDIFHKILYNKCCA